MFRCWENSIKIADKNLSSWGAYVLVGETENKHLFNDFPTAGYSSFCQSFAIINDMNITIFLYISFCIFVFLKDKLLKLEMLGQRKCSFFTLIQIVIAFQKDLAGLTTIAGAYE